MSSEIKYETVYIDRVYLKDRYAKLSRNFLPAVYGKLAGVKLTSYAVTLLIDFVTSYDSVVGQSRSNLRLSDFEPCIYTYGELADKYYTTRNTIASAVNELKGLKLISREPIPNSKKSIFKPNVEYLHSLVTKYLKQKIVQVD